MPVLQHPSIYRAQDAAVGNTPCVYLLVSTTQPDYIDKANLDLSPLRCKRRRY
jgi:hypothetical protein